MGTSPKDNYPNGAWEDHPHACGDKLVKICLVIEVIGSSPRVWGQETIVLIGIRKTGIIPTRVGTRHLRLIRQLKIQDHPHACGDKYDSSLSPVSPKGSSPRVWGQVKEYDSLSYDDRIIPTRVGTRHEEQKKPAR